VRAKQVIFIVSQDAKTIDAIEKPFEGSPTAFLRAENPRRAASQAKLAAPDVVILDDSLEGADWYDIYRRLSEELSFTFIPILVLLEAAKAEEAVGKMEAGLIDILIKPVNAHELKARLKAMLQVKAVHDQLDGERVELQQKLDEERRLRQELSAVNEELKRLSTTDGLTGLANYRYMRNWLSTEFEIATRYNLPLSAMMLDLDNFKSVNDRFGHPFGDFVLKGVAAIIIERSRKADFSARYGGEEFLIILPNTDGDAGANLAHRIHSGIERHVFDDGHCQVQITASLGISTHPSPNVKAAEDLIDLADRALYAAKAKGRNRVVSWREIE
jgi:two-component system chemotaxis family response regulator WspR